MEKLQVLVVTMKQSDFSKIKEMNLSTAAVIANQADDTRYDETQISGYTVKMITTTTRGVGINRNIALSYADGDILLLADDDVKYKDSYSNLVLDAFRKVPETDALIFIDIIGLDKAGRKNTAIKRVRYFNALNYGAVRIAVKRKRLIVNNINFTTCFGGGTIYSADEDSMYIWDMLKKGLKIYTYPLTIAEVNQTTSTWFNGFHKKYFYDKGALFSALIGKPMAYILCLQDLVRHSSVYSGSEFKFKQRFSEMKKGVCGYKDLSPYVEDCQYEKNKVGGVILYFKSLSAALLTSKMEGVKAA